MLNSDAVSRELLRGSRDGLILGESAAPTTLRRSNTAEVSGVSAVSFSLRGLTDRQLALLLSGVLLVVGAWPIFLTEVPPFQDLPNHLATATVIQNPAAYPEYAFNGFFKTNAALFTWLSTVGKITGLPLAAKLFALGTLSATAFVLPRFVLAFGASRKRTVIASLFAWPMVHNWFVSMGMLDFALAVPLSLALLIAIHRQRTLSTRARGPSGTASLRGAAIISALGLATWYAHVFPLLVVYLLVLIEAMTRRTNRERAISLRAMALPLLPVTLLALVSIGDQVRDAIGPMSAFMDSQKLVAPWELAYNLWAEWFWGYSNLSLSSIVPCVALAIVGARALWKRQTPAPAFFSPTALVVLFLLYAFVPYKLTNWFHVNSRLIPFLWVGLLLYVPESLPKRVIALLGICGLAYSVGMGADYVRLERERQEFTAGIEAVPEGAQLLPLLFRHKSASQNTRNLLHMWGYYVVERRTAAPLLFAHSRSFPVTYSSPPPIRFNHLVLEPFAPEATSPASVCRAAARFDECELLFESTWQRFYAEATPRYDHLLLWDATPEALAMVPKDYQPTFQRGRLMIYARSDVRAIR
jgi:hypothetical protein